MKETKCSKCGSDNTQSFKMANKMGTTSGTLAGVGLSADGDIGVGGGVSSTRTALAELTAPPEHDHSAGRSVAIIFLLLVANSVIFVLLMLVMEPTPAVITGSVLAIGVSVFTYYMLKQSNPKAEAVYKAAMMKWEHSWICMKCGHTFYVR
jgi:predicted nucleic-acid-binding Zn-ribbon protein